MRIRIVSIVLALLCTMDAVAGGVVNTSPFSKLAIHGYDPVAYFRQHAAVPGDRSITYVYEGVSWAFADKDNRNLFASSPNQYIPEYGGYCAFAASRNYISDADPTAWQVVNGKLYLNYDNRVQRTWAGELESNIDLADQNWPELAERLMAPDQ